MFITTIFKSLRERISTYNNITITIISIKINTRQVVIHNFLYKKLIDKNIGVSVSATVSLHHEICFHSTT